jgi:putative ABC transport system permease protein
MLLLGTVGVLVALPCAVLLGRTLRSQLFGVSAADPWTVAGVILLMGLIGLFATLIPARRAASIDPVQALRTQ